MKKVAFSVMLLPNHLEVYNNENTDLSSGCIYKPIIWRKPGSRVSLEQWPDSRTMQNIAAENNLSETAFFVKKDPGFEIRWFTPTVEVNLCGHATLASAHVILNHLDFKEEPIIFQSMNGELKVSKSGELLTLDFPATPPEPLEQVPCQWGSALNKEPYALYKSRDLVGLYESEDEVLAIKPDFEALSEVLTTVECLGMVITAPGKQVDFVSRFFAPLAGINEDPVTGSAHTTLIPFWAEKLNKNKLHAFQLSKRKGELFCQLAGDRVLISGKAVTYLKGEIEV